MKPLRVLLVATDHHLNRAFHMLARGTKRNQQKRKVIFCTFQNPNYDARDALVLGISRADVVLIGLSYPANFHGIPEEALEIAHAEEKPCGVYLEHPNLFKENGLTRHASQVSWILVPEEVSLSEQFPGVTVHITGAITTPHHTSSAFKFCKQGLSLFVHACTHLATAG